MSELAVGTAVVAWLWALAASILPLVAFARRRSLSRRTPKELRHPTRVLLIRPCAGLEPRLFENLVGLPAAKGVEIDVAIAVADPTDSAWPIACRAADALQQRGHSARALIVTALGANRKASMLAGIEAAYATGGSSSPYDSIVNADSNVDLSSFDLARLLAPLQLDARVGATWCAAVERPIPSATAEADAAVVDPRGLLPAWGSRATEAVLGGSLHAFSLLGGLDPGGLVGKLFAVKPEALRRTGGFGALVNFLGEDFRLAESLRASGYHVVPVFAPCRAVALPVTFSGCVARFSRWIQIVRAQRPWLLPTYPVFFFPTPWVAAISLVATLSGAPSALGAFALVLCGRIVTAVIARKCSGLSWNTSDVLLDMVLADTILALSFLRALRTRELVWRGRRLRIERSGEVSEL